MQINPRGTLTALLVTGLIFPTSKPEAGEKLVIIGKGEKIVYKNKIGDEWNTFEIHLKNGRKIQPFHKTGAMASTFEKGFESNFSKSQLYYVVNRIEHGVISAGTNDSPEDAERYYCAFINTNSGCIVREETGEFCGGHWNQNNDNWEVGEESTTIDIRTDPTKSKLDKHRYFREFSDAENFKRCFPKKN